MRRRGNEGDAPAGARMEKRKLHCVQQLSPRPYTQPPVCSRIAILHVADNRTAKLRRVNAYLVHPTGVDLELQQRDRAVLPQNLPMRYHPQAVTADRSVQGSCLLPGAPCRLQRYFLNVFVRLELVRKLR